MRTYDDTFSGQKIYPGKVRARKCNPTTNILACSNTLLAREWEERRKDLWIRQTAAAAGYICGMNCGIADNTS